MKFKIGDLVVASNLSRNANPSLTKDSVGIVLGYSLYNTVVAVDWQKNVRGGHDCSGRCRHGQGWNVREGEISLFGFNATIDVNGYL